MESIPDLITQKQRLRTIAKERRACLTQEQRVLYSQHILDRLYHSQAFHQSKRIMAFYSFGDEVDTYALLLEILVRQKRLVLPRMKPASPSPQGEGGGRRDLQLELYEVCHIPQDLAVGAWGIHEPNPARCRYYPIEDLQHLDLIIVPGVAFSETGKRLGYGRGYYDRLLAYLNNDASMQLMALAFEVQLFETIPTEAHDHAIPQIITENRMILCHKKTS